MKNTTYKETLSPKNILDMSIASLIMNGCNLLVFHVKLFVIFFYIIFFFFVIIICVSTFTTQMKFDNDEFEEEIYDEDKYDALNDETFGNDMSGTVFKSFIYT